MYCTNNIVQYCADKRIGHTHIDTLYRDYIIKRKENAYVKFTSYPLRPRIDPFKLNRQEETDAIVGAIIRDDKAGGPIKEGGEILYSGEAEMQISWITWERESKLLTKSGSQF